MQVSVIVLAPLLVVVTDSVLDLLNTKSDMSIEQGRTGTPLDPRANTLNGPPPQDYNNVYLIEFLCEFKS